MPSSATVTAKDGAAQQVTAAVLSNITRFDADVSRLVLTVYQGTSYKEFDLHGVTTFTVSVSSDVYTLTIS
jgi:hypothetical protein